MNRTLLYFAFLAPLGLLINTQVRAKTETGKSDKGIVFVETVAKKNLSDTFIYPAVVDSKINALANSETEGVVKAIHVSPGSTVQSGQTLMVIENPDPIYHYAPVSVKAPMRGIVSTIDVSLLSRVEKGQKLFSIIDPKALKLEFEVPAGDIPSLKIGLAGHFRINQNDDQEILVKIGGLSPLIDPRTGTSRGTLELPASKKDLEKLRPGMIGQIRFATNSREKIVVPESAVLYREGKTWVRVIDGTKSKKTQVKLGNRIADSFEILEGLQDKMVFVVRSSRFVADGEEVQVENNKSDISKGKN